MKIQTQDRSHLQYPQWELQNIPQELKDINQWQECYRIGEIDPSGQPVTTPKRPKGGSNPPFPLSYHQATKDLSDFKHFGFALKKDDPYIIIDVDDLKAGFTQEDLPDTLKTLLSAFPTYSELSPSGQGLHIIYRATKDTLKAYGAKTDGVINFKGTLYIHSSFVTTTGHIFNKANKIITDISVQILEALVVAPTNVTRHPKFTPEYPQGLGKVNFTLDDVSRYLYTLPGSLTASIFEHPLREAYSKFSQDLRNISDYTHWQYIAASLNHACSLIGETEAGAVLFADWSKTNDPNGSFSSDKDAVDKYYANPAKDAQDNQITYLTLFALAKSLKPKWPFVAPQKDKNAAITPLINNSHNWSALFKFFGVEILQNTVTKEYVFKGPQALIDRYFGAHPISGSEEMVSRVLAFAHANGMPNAGASSGSIGAKHMTVHAKKFNPIKQWIDDAPPHDPSGPSYFEELWQTLHLQDHEAHNAPLFRSYLKKNLMGIIRAHYYRGRHRSTTGIVILSGGENTYKSTWLQQLLPQKLSEEYIFLSQASLNRSNPIKEIQLETAHCQIWVKDEAGVFLRADGDIIKNFLVQPNDLARGLWKTKPTPTPRMCIFFGTTNRSELQITDDGSRRFQIIPVKLCDTKAQAKLDMVRVYRELLYEFEQEKGSKVKLWALSDEELQLTNQINEKCRGTESDLDLLLQQTYATEVPFNMDDFTGNQGAIMYGKLTTQRQVKEDIVRATNTSLAKLSAIPHAMARLCREWTGLRGISYKDKWIIKDGRAWREKTDGTKSQDGFIAPPVRIDWEMAQMKKSKEELT